MPWWRGDRNAAWFRRSPGNVPRCGTLGRRSGGAEAPLRGGQDGLRRGDDGGRPLGGGSRAREMGAGPSYRTARGCYPLRAVVVERVGVRPLPLRRPGPRAGHGRRRGRGALTAGRGRTDPFRNRGTRDLARGLRRRSRRRVPTATRPRGRTSADRPGLVATRASVPRIERGVKAIFGALAAGEAAAVRCGGGLGRTGTVLVCYLPRSGRRERRGASRRSVWACTSAASPCRAP